MVNKIPSSIYGPVNSWRLGRSLGVDVLCIDSICSFECVYCQLGKINRVTSERSVFVTTKKIMSDLRASDWETADVITFSGSGEPTLALNLGNVIKEIKEFTELPIIVLTNSTLLHLKKVREELLLCDRIFCKLDGWDENSMKRVDRPLEDISFGHIVSGIGDLRREFTGFLAIQTMVLKQWGDAEIELYSKLVASLRPDEIQLNLPSRPVPDSYTTESRGNITAASDNAQQLKTISAAALGAIAKSVEEQTRITVMIR